MFAFGAVVPRLKPGEADSPLRNSLERKTKKSSDSRHRPDIQFGVAALARFTAQ
jgi:hypothetical protein